MARAPKIPGLRQWLKVKRSSGYRDEYQYKVPGGPTLFLWTLPHRRAEGPATGHYGAAQPAGVMEPMAATPTVATRGEAIRHLRAWLRQHVRANPLTPVESRDAIRMANRVHVRPKHGNLDRHYDQGYEDGVIKTVDTFGDQRALDAAHRLEVRTGRRPVGRRNPGGLAFDDVRPGDRVTILVPAGRGRGGQEYTECTGRVVMRGPAGWVLNLGGPHGTPGVATPENFVRATRGKPSERHGGFGTMRGNPVVAAPRSVRGNPSRHVYTIATKDIDQSHIRIRGQAWPVEDWIGNILPRDVGKHVYLVGAPGDEILQVENDAQRDARLRRANPARRYPKASQKTRPKKRRNPTSAICRHTLPLAKGGHGRVTVCFPQGVFPSLKAAVVNIQRELRAKFGRLKSAPVVRRAEWAYSDAGRTRGRWTFTG